MTSKRILFRNALIAATSVVFMAGTLAACDEQDTRKSRIEGLLDDVVDQLAGEETAETPATAPSRLEAAAPAERAIAGRLSEEARAAIASERKRFAVGSIVAKPLAVDALQAEAEALEPDFAEAFIEEPDLAAAEEAVPPPEPVIVNEDTVPDGASGVQAAPPAPVLQRRAIGPRSGTRRMNRQAMKSRRRMARAPRVREAQLDAQSTMFNEMDKLGLSGSVSASDSGMMVIDLFADPTQFVEGTDPTPLIAADAELACPDTVDKAVSYTHLTLPTNREV